jgi:hypothetical protein
MSARLQKGRRSVLQERIGYLLKRPVGRPSNDVRRSYASFTYQAGSWSRPRRVIDRSDPIEDDLCRHHIAVARGGKNSIDDLFHVVLHKLLGEQRRLVSRALWLPGRIPGLPFLKPMFQICDCIFSHGHSAVPRHLRFGVFQPQHRNKRCFH